MSPTCFLEGSKILCLINNREVYVPIEKIKRGMLVKTNFNGYYKPVELIGYSVIDNKFNIKYSTNLTNLTNSSRSDNYIEEPESLLYKCSKENYPELDEDLIITENHSILVDRLTEKQKEKTKKKLGDIYKTHNKFRLIASIDERAEPWLVPGKHTIWHIALVNDKLDHNYGIYANGGLLVESISINTLKNKSNMILV